MQNQYSVLHVKVSWFNNYHSTEPAGTTTLLDWLTNNKHAEKVLQIRKSTDKAVRNRLKAQLPAITPSGVFSRRTDSAMLQHSGFLCLDIDLQDNKHISNYTQLKSEMAKIKQVAYCGLSVSGDGFFVLIPIAYPDKHLQHFLALQTVFASFGIQLDEKCKNLSRLRGYSWDPEAYFNHQAIPFTGLLSTNPKPTPHVKQTYQARPSNDYEKVEQLVRQIEQRGIDITADYNYWFAIACNLASTFGEAGRDFFHRISWLYPNYRQVEADAKFNEALKRNPTASLGAFINRCRHYQVR